MCSKQTFPKAGICMDPTELFPSETFLEEDAFQFVKRDDFDAFGIDPADVPLGTMAALRHPCQLQSKFGGNAYGFGLFEVYDLLKPRDTRLLQSISFENPEVIGEHYKDLNEIYKKIGLLIRFSRLGNPYYLIPVHLISNSLVHIKTRVDEISKTVGYHLKKYLKKHYEIGVLCHQDDLIFQELTLRFKEHHFVGIDSFEKIRNLNRTLDFLILTRDIYEIVLMDDFTPLSREVVSKKRLDQYATYLLWKLYNLLKPDGEFLILANHYTPKTNRTTKIIFKTDLEQKHFLLFCHIFKTRKKYTPKNHSVEVNIFDFQKYLSNPYIEQEVENKLLEGRSLESMSIEQVMALPYRSFQLSDWRFLSNQQKTWSRLLSIFFNKVLLKPLVPQSTIADWDKRFSCTDYDPKYMIMYLGQKKPSEITLDDVKRDVRESCLISFSADLLADYRDSFAYVTRTLRVLEKLKDGTYQGLPQKFDRLRQPLRDKGRRFSALDDVLGLITKINRLQKIKDCLNPDGIEGTRTKVLDNFEALSLFGFAPNELREIMLIILGHTALGRIISGKMNEKSLKSLSDLACTYDLHNALNLLRYCRLMTMAEIESTRGSELTQEEFNQLFYLYESIVRVIVDRELDWEGFLDEKITSMGGVHYEIIRKLLMMMSRFEFLDNWSKLKEKGQMEKESLADYDNEKLSRIEDVIDLVNTIEQFEEMYLKFDPLQLPAFYRKFLDIEFHGTVRLFERMKGKSVFVILWIMVNVARGEIINFNPILADMETDDIGDRINKVEQEVRSINIHHLNLSILRQFSDQLYHNRSSFIVGTGFMLITDPETRALEISYMDMDMDMERLEFLSKEFSGLSISKIHIQDLKSLEVLFSHLEISYQSHIRLINDRVYTHKLPYRQRRWFARAQGLRDDLRSNLLDMAFRPEDIYTDLDLLYTYAPSVLNFVLPEFMALQDLDLSTHLYLKSPVTHYIMNSAKKLQSLIKHDKGSFQDTQFLHKLAQKEFGPMATGIVGVSESQIEDLEKIVERLSSNQQLFDALAKSFIFQDIGRTPVLREKYKNAINPADLSQAGAMFIDKEKIAERYHFDKKAKAYLVSLISHHALLHHIFRGELPFYAIQDVVESRDKDFFDAFFVFSFIMLSSLRQDLLLEDLATRLFQIRTLCHRIIDGETTPETYLNEIFVQRAKVFFALKNFQMKGLPDGVTPSSYLESWEGKELEKEKGIQAGRMIFGLERVFRLHGIRYVEFIDLARSWLGTPLEFIYRKRKFSSVGYDTFKEEISETSHIYATFQKLPEQARHFMLNLLVGDEVHIFGYEKVSGYLTYENKIKILLIGLIGSRKFKRSDRPVCLNFLGMSEKIERRHEAVNDCLSKLNANDIWQGKYRLNHLFRARTGIILSVEDFPNVLSLDFKDRINIPRKIDYMVGIDSAKRLRIYFRNSVQMLRKHHFYTDDYQMQLETVYKTRLNEIIDVRLEQTKQQMDRIEDFEELHNLLRDLLKGPREIGISDENKYRLKDLYELRKDSLTREKLTEFERVLGTIRNTHELKEYWSKIKWYLQKNRKFFGKQLENIVAKKFDEAQNTMEE